MIHSALQFVATTLNQFLKNEIGLDEQIVTLNHIATSDGSEPLENKNKVVISLINLDYESLKPYDIINRKSENNSYEKASPVQRINLNILACANFEDYKESLKFLGATLHFFQLNPAFNRENCSSLPSDIEKIQLDTEQINYSEMHNLWSAMGAKYKPSIVYKMRMTTIQGGDLDTFDSIVSSIKTKTSQE